MEPIISIITITFNNINGLKKTLRSVEKQMGDVSYEHIIIDGGSTDGSAELINDYKERIAKIERGDNDIGLVEGDIEKTKELIKPVDLICGFVDNLIYGEYSKEQIQQYLTIWKEKSNINPLAPADINISPSGRHTNLAYTEKEQGEKDYR